METESVTFKGNVTSRNPTCEGIEQYLSPQTLEKMFKHELHSPEIPEIPEYGSIDAENS